MDFQMLKEIKKKMDYDNDKRKQSSDHEYSLHEFLSKNIKVTPKTFSPDHKPINPKMSQNSEFCKNNNANTISSKLNFVNLSNFTDFKEKMNISKNKITESPIRRRINSYHRKTPSDTSNFSKITLKNQLINETLSLKADAMNNNSKIKKKLEFLSKNRNENFSGLISERCDDKRNIVEVKTNENSVRNPKM